MDGGPHRSPPLPPPPPHALAPIGGGTPEPVWPIPLTHRGGVLLIQSPGPPYTQWQQLPHSSPQRSWTEPWGGGGTAPLPASDRTRLALGDTTPRSPIFLPPARVDGRRRSHSPRHPLWPWPEPRSVAPPPRRLLTLWLRPFPLILLNGDAPPATAHACGSMAAPKGLQWPYGVMAAPIGRQPYSRWAENGVKRGHRARRSPRTASPAPPSHRPFTVRTEGPRDGGLAPHVWVLSRGGSWVPARCCAGEQHQPFLTESITSSPRCQGCPCPKTQAKICARSQQESRSPSALPPKNFSFDNQLLLELLPLAHCFQPRTRGSGICLLCRQGRTRQGEASSSPWPCPRAPRWGHLQLLNPRWQINLLFYSSAVQQQIPQGER